jgi:hypothetical protein
MLSGLIPSVGTVGDALDNALAETAIGLYETERARGFTVSKRTAAHPDRSRGHHLGVGALVSTRAD